MIHRSFYLITTHPEDKTVSHYLIYANKNEAGQPNGSYRMTTGVRHHPVVPLDLMEKFSEELTKAIQQGDGLGSISADIITKIIARKGFFQTVEVTYMLNGDEYTIMLDGTSGTVTYRAIAQHYHEYVEGNRWFTPSTHQVIPLMPAQAAPSRGLMGNPL